jgi:hypothetical protein
LKSYDKRAKQEDQLREVETKLKEATLEMLEPRSAVKTLPFKNTPISAPNVVN